MDEQMTVEQFVVWESMQPLRHEYHRGDIVTIVGGRMGDSTVKFNVVAALRRVMNGMPCRVVAGVLLHVNDHAAYYPDAMVVCGDLAAAAARTCTNEAKLVVEVLSPSTAAFDRGEKVKMYLQMPSLSAYLMVHPDERTVWIVERGVDQWHVRELALPPVFVALRSRAQGLAS